MESTKKRKFSTLEDNEYIAFTIDTVAKPPRVAVNGDQDLIYDATSFH